MTFLRERRVCLSLSLLFSRFSLLAARGAELVYRASDAINTAAESVELPVGLEPLTVGQCLAKHTDLFVLIALVEAAAGHWLIAEFLEKRRYRLDPDTAPVRGQGAPSRHRQAIAVRSFG